ncbi:hypothetical protein [Flavobacterium inviolabile]|uniref:hypothetical protein n=1 Tax=Flavobacterium inviolabile TaxID=2748320 RepID=UPI0015ADFF70|nr:hypothetical protein [Flavobacterium inviolabile]
MSLDASNYIKNRQKLSLSRKRIKEVLVCVINSYEKIISDGVVFDYSKRGKIKQEDFLRNRLVDDYLESELRSLELGTERFTINKETSEEYSSLIDNVLHNDPIDIHIVDKAQQESWGKDTKPYFAIECKRIVSSVSDYVKDTKKFAERDYTKLRLPFEGQLGFVENSSLNHISISEKINENLSSNTEIVTIKQLEPYKLKDSFDASYLSGHKKKNNADFTVLHLFFNYSEIVIN